jgi:small subunit ribosomal protein S7
MRRPLKKKHELRPDIRYGSTNVSKLINYVMERGKKETARKIVYGALGQLEGTVIKNENDEEIKPEPLELFETALKNVGPLMEVRSRRVGGANYQVPREVRPERRLALSLRWIVGAAKSGKGKPMADRLATEIRLAAQNEGEAVKKRENVHKMAEANKAFAHFAW